LDSHRFPNRFSWKIVLLNISFSILETLSAEVFYNWINASFVDVVVDGFGVLHSSPVLFGLWFAKHYFSNTIPTQFKEK